MSKLNKKVVVSVVTLSRNSELVDELKKYFSEVSINEKGERYTEMELREALKDADAAIIGLDKIDESLLSHCSKLEVISKHGIGTDKIDFDACKRYGVDVKLQEGTNRRSVSELTLGFMLSLMRGAYSPSLQLKEGIWNKYGSQGRNLTGKTIGIIGVGNIGKDLVSLLTPFNCHIIANDLRQDSEQKQFYQDYAIEEVPKETIYKKSDIITIHAPLTDLTRGMITQKELQYMKPSAFIINTARSRIINETDLLLALKNNIIAGAGLDVYDNEEPPYNLELLGLPNVYCTPHIGGTSKEASIALGIKAIQNLKDYFGVKNG
jgi:phosphoglycerate dehydrogenase-like enzyme